MNTFRSALASSTQPNVDRGVLSPLRAASMFCNSWAACSRNPAWNSRPCMEAIANANGSTQEAATRDVATPASLGGEPDQTRTDRCRVSHHECRGRMTSKPRYRRRRSGLPSITSQNRLTISSRVYGAASRIKSAMSVEDSLSSSRLVKREPSSCRAGIQHRADVPVVPSCSCHVTRDGHTAARINTPPDSI